MPRCACQHVHSTTTQNSHTAETLPHASEKAHSLLRVNYMLHSKLLSGVELCRSLHRLLPSPVHSCHQARSSWSACRRSFAAMAAAVEPAVAKRTVRGVVFDMDGTLTVPVIDFQYMRQRVGVGPSGDILDIISSWSAEEQLRAHKAIEEIEEQALRDMQAMPGLVDLCTFLDSQGVPRGLITRNVLRSVHFFHQNHMPLPPFVPAISRECQFPYKPSPEALLHICKTWGILPSEVIMVGDSAKDDVVCGNRAGAVTILLDTEGRYNDPQSLQGECKPTMVAKSLSEVHELLLTTFELLPPEKLQQQELDLSSACQAQAA